MDVDKYIYVVSMMIHSSCVNRYIYQSSIITHMCGARDVCLWQGVRHRAWCVFLYCVGWLIDFWCADCVCMCVKGVRGYCF